jgi:hypothetical protein
MNEKEPEYKIITNTNIPPKLSHESRPKTKKHIQTTQFKPKPNEPEFKLIDPETLPQDYHTKRIEYYLQILNSIPKGKTLQMSDSKRVNLQSMMSFISLEQNNGHLGKIKYCQRTIKDFTTDPPTKMKYLYITRSP